VDSLSRNPFVGFAPWIIFAAGRTVPAKVPA
jgi:hypothetical protein